MATSQASNSGAATEQLALVVLRDKLFRILLESGPKKTGELVAALDHPQVTLQLAKHALKTSDRFIMTLRKWDISPRWESPEVPFEKLLAGLLKAAGFPMTAQQMGGVVAQVMEREEESMAEVAAKFASENPTFAQLTDGRFVLSAWLIDPAYNKLDDVLFYNFIEPEEIEAVRPLAEGLDFDTGTAESIASIASKHSGQARFKALAVLAWEEQNRYLDCEELYASVIANDAIGVSSDQVIFDARKESELLSSLKKLTISVDEEDEEEDAEEAPPTITDADLDEIAKTISSRTETTHLADILLSVFELEPGEKAYSITEGELVERLRHDPRFVWLGADRFRPIGSIPEFVFSTPENLKIPEYDFSTDDGERFDIEMEAAGLEAGVSKEVHELLVQDVEDEDAPQKVAKRPTEADCVVKYHHKIAGTFPLAQLPDGFFPQEPQIQEIVLLQGGKKHIVWVSRETRLVYNLEAVYNELDLPIAGGKFTLSATARPDTFELIHTGGVDETAGVQPGRLLELLQLKEEADNERLPTFEVICRMLERQSNGMSFPHLFIELNLIRRVPRMLVASILSGYACFSRHPKSGLWAFDEKKKDQGFTKAKRKYVVKES